MLFQDHSHCGNCVSRCIKQETTMRQNFLAKVSSSFHSKGCIHHTTRLPLHAHRDMVMTVRCNTHQTSNGSRKPVYSLNDAGFQPVNQAARKNSN